MNMEIPFAYLVSDRKADEDLDALCESIQWDGLVRPPVVEPLGDGRFKIVEGTRRYHAINRLMESAASVWSERLFKPASSVFAVVKCVIR